MSLPIPIIQGNQKPDRLLSEDQKDDKYHIDYARWAINNGTDSNYQAHMNRIQVNKRFYKPNQQWSYREDLEEFLMDESGQDRNRIKVEMNHIQPMVNQYVGNASNMGITSRMRSFSPLVKNRKEEQLEEILMFSDVANNASKDNPIGTVLKDKMPIGDTEEETTQIHENTYVDKYIDNMNNLMAYSEVVNGFQSNKERVAEDMALSGMAIEFPYIQGGEYLFKRILAERFIFDRSGIEYDGSDQGFQGIWDKMLPTELYERFQDISDDNRQRIEKFSQTYGSSGSGGSYYRDAYSSSGRILVYTMYWRDSVKDTWGYVIDQFGNKVYERIDHIYEGDDTPKYTKADVLDVSELTPYERNEVLGLSKKAKGKGMVNKFTDQWRYCIFIPSEVLGTSEKSPKNLGGIVLEKGIAPFQEPDLYAPSNMKPPFKMCFYVYLDGEVYSPVDVAINPQRMINRFFSVFENQVNNSRGAGTAYDPDMIEDEPEFLRNMDQNKPVAVRTKGLQMQNAIGRYDNTIGAGTVSLLQFAESFKQGMEQITGVNEPLKGQSTGADQLVGVTQLMIQKGSIVQQRFYSQIEHLYNDCYQAVATSGKRLYIQEKTTLIDITGEEGYEVLSLSKEMANEAFRVEVTLVQDPAQERALVDGNLERYMQLGLITDITFANLFGRGTFHQLAMGLRADAKQRQEVQRQVGKIQQQQGQQQEQLMIDAQMKQQASEEADKVIENVNQDKERQNKLDVQDKKNEGLLSVQDSKNNSQQK